MNLMRNVDLNACPAAHAILTKRAAVEKTNFRTQG
jgi:hypothetical protein